MIADLANVLEVCPQALTIPDIDNYKGLAHTLFALEDLYGIKIDNNDGELRLILDRENKSYHSMFEIFDVWSNEAEKLENGEISKEDYDTWRYNYQEIETKRFRDSIDRLREEKDVVREDD